MNNIVDSSAWLSYFAGDANAEVFATPIEIIEIHRPDVPTSQYFYFDRMLRRAYRIRFPLNFKDGTPVVTSSTRFLQLTFSSAIGQADLRWDFGLDHK